MSPATDMRAGRVTLRTLSAHLGQKYYTYLPRRLRRPDLLLIAVHGISRNAREHALQFAQAAESLGCALLAPLMAEETAAGYQRLGWGRGERRADLLLDACIADLEARLSRSFPRLALWGFSGGAQFAHRYALSQPQRVAAQVLGAAGWYTWPDPALRFPYGVSARGLRAQQTLDLEGFLRIPTLVVVGSRDVVRDDATRTGPRLDEQQGHHRLERARRWVAAINAAALQRGLAAPAQLEVLPGVAHEFDAVVDAGGVGHAEAWWTRHALRAAAAPRVHATKEGEIPCIRSSIA